MLLVRPGAIYRCEGDGLCCTDIHAFGPVSTAEAKKLRLVVPQPVQWHSELKMSVIKAAPSGTCIFMENHQVGGGCRVHASQGVFAKPNTCRRFPFGLTRTPQGARITMEHRCPCRTMGERPELTSDVALESVTDRGGRLVFDTEVGNQLKLNKSKRISFSKYLELEALMFERLFAGQDALEVLGVEPMPTLPQASWGDVGHLFRAEIDLTAGGAAQGWFGDTLLFLLGQKGAPSRRRPWTASFDRAEARSKPGDPVRMLNDWVADVIWSLHWTELCSFDAMRAELATRVVVANSIYSTLKKQGARADRAMAEAIAIVEIAGASELWARVENDINNSSNIMPAAHD